ncbi:MAG: glucuronate isomerase [Phycisphaerae bacterium]|nr:glucuronate isomerase [Phycisphaerae bacterium]
MPITDPHALAATVRKAVADVTITDIHTHLFPPSHGGLLLWGIDELLTYHYLLAELFIATGQPPKAFYALPKSRQAEMVWDEMFLRRSPVTEAARGVLQVIQSLGLDAGERDLVTLRKAFAGLTARPEEYLERVFTLAGLDYAVMTNDPFVPAEVDAWLANRPVPERLKTALRIDTMVTNWPAAVLKMAAQGHSSSGGGTTQTARKFLAEWVARIKPLYLAASLPDSFRYDGVRATDPNDDNPSNHAADRRHVCEPSRVLDDVILPLARETGLPLALMIGVRRQVNSEFGLAGDGVGATHVASVAALAAKNPDVKFLITTLARGDQHELAVTARKFANLHLFGCWWFCNQSSIIREMTTLRVELLGTAFTANHSDARVLDQLLYKWPTTRKIVADVLTEKYGELFATGWRPTEQEIATDIRRILGGSFEAFVAR